MDTNQIRQIIKSLNIVLRCPRCGKKFSPEEIFLKNSVGSTYFLQLNCSGCQNPVYASITLSGNMVPQITPQKPNTIEPTSKKSPITSDDIIEMHEFLKNFKGRISDII